eukprot:SAG11_NODE_12731_length_688_cov_1.130730_1_plen_195_part_01
MRLQVSDEVVAAMVQHGSPPHEDGWDYRAVVHLVESHAKLETTLERAREAHEAKHAELATHIEELATIQVDEHEDLMGRVEVLEPLREKLEPVSAANQRPGCHDVCTIENRSLWSAGGVPQQAHETRINELIKSANEFEATVTHGKLQHLEVDMQRFVHDQLATMHETGEQAQTEIQDLRRNVDTLNHSRREERC